MYPCSAWLFAFVFRRIFSLWLGRVTSLAGVVGGAVKRGVGGEPTLQQGWVGGRG